MHPRGGGPSKATAQTICQKCLQSGHYSYECKSERERPYVSRPSRTQQFLNPKLRPKLTNDTLKPADPTPTVSTTGTSKKHADDAVGRDLRPRSMYRSSSRSGSSRSSSVSTISTGSSRSASPHRDNHERTYRPGHQQTGVKRSRPRSTSDDERTGRADGGRNIRRTEVTEPDPRGLSRRTSVSEQHVSGNVNDDIKADGGLSPYSKRMALSGDADPR